jgi:hypothetical protein
MYRRVQQQPRRMRVNQYRHDIRSTDQSTQHMQCHVKRLTVFGQKHLLVKTVEREPGARVFHAKSLKGCKVEIIRVIARKRYSLSISPFPSLGVAGILDLFTHFSVA